jgi:hypothetical protein
MVNRRGRPLLRFFHMNEAERMGEIYGKAETGDHHSD